MKNILQKWLQDRLGLLIEMEKVDGSMRDGTMFVRILKYYNAINPKYIDIKPSEDVFVCQINLTQLKVWFKLLNIDFSSEIIKDILDGKVSSCVHILYQMYLCFENINSVHFVPKQKERFVRKHHKKYKVTELSMSDVLLEKPDDQNKNIYKYSNRILEHNDIIKWYGNKHCKKKKSPDDKSSFLVPICVKGNGSIKGSKCKSKKKLQFEEDVRYVRNELSVTSELNSTTSYESLSIKDYIDFGYKNSRSPAFKKANLCRPDSDVHERGHFLPPIATKGKQSSTLGCADITYSVENYLKKLKCVVKMSFNKKFVSKNVCDFIIKDVWNMVLDIEEEDFRKIIARRLLKQSLFERKLSMKFLQTMQQSRVQKQSYAELEKRMNDPHYSNTSKYCIDDDICFRNKDEKHQFYHDFLLYYQDERKRTVELHRRLYAEKLKLRFQKHYALCLQTIEDIIDIAIKKSEFKAMYEMEVPDKLWAQIVCLFYHGLPVFDVDNICLDINNDFDVTDTVELNKQTVLNEWDLDNYLDVQREWDNLFEQDLSNPFYCSYLNNPENQFVLGYVVHRLLEFKYPSLPPPKPADIPKYSFRVILNEIGEEEVIIKLQRLLNKAEILVIDVNSAANFCLQCYKNEIGSENIDVSDNKTLKFPVIDSGNIKSEELLVVADSNNHDVEKFQDKNIQTSVSSFYDVNNTQLLGEAAKLGGELFNSMLLGSELPTDLIVNVIIEYIKNSQDKIKGWVLVNFPSTLFQASVLEYALTSKSFPYNLDDDTASMFDSEVIPGKDSKDVKDNNSNNFEMEVKSSRIVPNPRECGGEDVFKTYFSKFITAVKGESASFNAFGSYSIDEEYDSLQLHSDSTLLLEHPEREGVPAINEFYREQGISYDFIYEMFDLSTLKQLARLILYQSTDDNLQISSVDLFGEDVLDVLGGSNNLSRYEVVDAGKAEVTKTKADKNMMSSISEHIDLLSSVDLDLHLIPDNCESVIVSTKKEALLKPGDRNWVYASRSVPESLAVGLASFWESSETVYLNSLKDVFFLKRNTDYSLIPYIHYITKTMESCFNQEDERQSIVNSFLVNFNEIHQVLRSDEDMKVELHLRVIELKEQLMELCENKRDSAEELRRTLINQNWTYIQMVAVGNCFISMLQIEMDRCMRTLDMLKDYYLSMLGVFKPESLFLQDLTLSTINLVVEEESRESALALEIIEHMLDYSSSTELTNPVYNVVENKATELSSKIEKLKSVAESLINSEETLALKVQKDLSQKQELELKESEKKQRQSSPGKKRSRSKDDQLMKQFLQAVSDMKEEADRKELEVKDFFIEWSHAVKGEVDRGLFRIEMIKKKTLLDIMEIDNAMACTFRNFYDVLMSNFESECHCIDRLCLLFQLAIEEKTPVHADISFVVDKLIVSKKEIEKPPTVVKLPRALEEMLFEESFTVKQLQEMKELLMLIAPDGIICQEAFVDLIQNLIIQGNSHTTVKLVPNLWSKLRPDELNLFFRKVFGNVGLVEWRDFLIYCLDLPYPVTEDLIDAKLQFLRYDPQETETVSYENYMNTTLWFHRELPETPLQALHNILAKEYLFTLYKIPDKNLINYTSLLMAFCKDEDVKVGFGKGLSLLYGRCVIVFEEDLFLEKILSDHINTGFKVVDQILDDIVEDVVVTALDITKDCSEFRYRENSLNDFDTSETSINVNATDKEYATESMYDQFFRRHIVLQWTSKVPHVIIVTLLSIMFHPSYMLYYVFESYSQIFEEIRNQVSALQEIGEDYVYVPSFLDDWCLSGIFFNYYKFKALSLNDVVKGIISDRN